MIFTRIAYNVQTSTRLSRSEIRILEKLQYGNNIQLHSADRHTRVPESTNDLYYNNAH